MGSRLLRVGARSGVVLAGFVAAACPAQAAGVITANPASAKFSAQLYASSPGKNITVKNTGAAAFQLGAVSFDGPDAGDFATLSDGCGNHLIGPRKSCKLRLEFNATAPVHAVESARVSINDPGGNALASVALSGTVAKRELSAALSGLTVTSTTTQFQYDLEVDFDGPFYDTGNGSCGSRLIGNHGMGDAKIASCTIEVGRSGPGSGALDLSVDGDIDGGKSYSFDILLN